MNAVMKKAEKGVQLMADLEVWHEVWQSSLTFNLMSDSERLRNDENFEKLKRLAMMAIT